MGQRITNGDVAAQLLARIARLEHDVSRMAEPAVVTELKPGEIGHPFGNGQPVFVIHSDQASFAPTPTSFREGRAKLARNQIRQRRTRDRYFRAEMFADPAWDMMLDLYAAHYEERRVSVSSLCIAAAVPATTALRWINLLTKDAVLERRKDLADGRRIYVHLSEQTRLKLDDYFDWLGQSATPGAAYRPISG